MYRILDVNHFDNEATKWRTRCIYTQWHSTWRRRGFLFLAWTDHVCVCQADVCVNEVSDVLL